MSSVGLIDGIYPKQHDDAMPKESTVFSAWHKPRKQWMRQNQWLHEVELLISSKKFDGRPLRYFSLPGEDMFDLRMIADLCASHSLRMKCLGFDKTRIASTSITWNEISEVIDQHSVLAQDELEELANKESQAYNYLEAIGPFDAINIDLCGSIAVGRDPKLHRAIHNIAEYQFNHTNEDWLLFITTRGEQAGVNPNYLPYYLNAIHRNTVASDDFGSRFKDVTGIDMGMYDSNAPASIIEGCDRVTFLKVFGAGFSKWLLGLGAGVHWNVTMKECYCYRVARARRTDYTPNMLSLAYLFSPIAQPVVDRTNLIQSTAAQPVNETELAMRVLEETERMKDVDAIVNRDDVYAEMIDSTSKLLIPKYDISRYRQWAQEERLNV